MLKSINLLQILIVSIIIKNYESIKPIILFNNDDNGINYEILKVDNNRIIITENTTKLLETNYKIKSLDFNWRDKHLVWSSGEYPNPIFLAEFQFREINENETRIRVTKRSIISSKNSQTRLAFDWIHNLVYFFKYNILTVVDVRYPEIGYELTRKQDREVWKYTSGGIAVNPFDSFIVWTEYNTIDGIAVIRKCNEDGSEQQILVYKDIRLPVCIAIDFETKTILWIDNELHSLSSIDYLGNNRKTLKQSKDMFNDCSTLEVFDHFIYWSSPKENKIMKMNISGGAEHIQTAPADVVVISELDIDFVKILSPLQPQNATNYCENSNCSHICLPNSNQSYRCLCPNVPQLYVCNETKLTFPMAKIPEVKQNKSAVSQLIQSQEPLLLFTARKRDIRLTPLPDNDMIYYMDSEFLYKLDHYVSALDFSLFGNFLVWLKTDSSIYTYLSKTTLFVTPIDESNNNSLNVDTMKPMMNISESSLIKTLAVDWIHNLAYFPLCDTSMSLTKGIFAMNLSTPETLYQIIPQSTCATKDVRVDPSESLLFWSEYKESIFSNPYSRYTSISYSRHRTTDNNKHQIKKSSQDGHNIVVLAESQYIRKNSLTLDIVDKRVYWINFQLYSNTLYSVSYDGTGIKSSSLALNLFDDLSMDLFNDYIYWTNSGDDTIRRISKNQSIHSESQIVVQSGVDIDAIKILHKSRQPNGTNRCLNHNCLHICLPSTTKEHNYTCYCPRGQEWNGQACRFNSTKPSTTTESSVQTTSSSAKQNSLIVLDDEPKLLYVVYKEGIYVKPNLVDLNTNYIESIELLAKTEWITEVDYSFVGNYLLWLESSVFEGFTLSAAPIDKSKPNSLTLINEKKIVSKVYNSKRLAFDWIHNLVYLCIPKGIEVYSIDQIVYIYDIVTHEEIQGDVAVDPIHGYIFWSQWKYAAFTNVHNGKIYRANQDGSDHTVLYNEAKIPNTLAIDMDQQMVYWIDTSTHALLSISYIGTNFTSILVSNKLFDGSFSMDVFGDYIYWSNYDKNSILASHKNGLNSTDKIVLINSYTDLEGIKVLDRSRQPNGTNQCQNANCSQLCLPVGQEYRCVCAKNKIGLMNECVESKVVTTKSTTTTAMDIIPIPITSASVDNHYHYMSNISNKLDSLLNSTLLRTHEKESNNHWIVILLLSLAVNLILIAIFIYRKKKMNPISKYILAKFQNDREEIFLDERNNDDL